MTVDEVWSWPSAVAAVVAGALVSAYIWYIHIRRPAWNGRALPALVFVDTLVASFLFTASQVAAAWYSGDSGWIRIMSRYGLWVVFAASLAVGLWAFVQVRHRRKA